MDSERSSAAFTDGRPGAEATGAAGSSAETQACADTRAVPASGAVIAATDGDAVALAELAARLRLSVNRLTRRLRRQGGDALSPSMVSALVTLELHGPMTLGGLAAHEMITPPSVTRLVGELERRELVRREPDPADRRAVRVSLAAAGRRELARVRSRKTAYLARRLGELDEAELAALRAALPVLDRLLREER